MTSSPADARTTTVPGFVGIPLRSAAHYSRPMPASRRRAAEALRSSTGALSTAATGRMSSDLPWFDDLSAEDRSWVGLIVQAGIRGFVDWYDVEVEASAHDPLDVVVLVPPRASSPASSRSNRPSSWCG